MTEQPTGTVTLLFSDIEGSTRLLERLGVDRFSEALELHRRLLRHAFSEQDGFEVDCDGDSFFVAFPQAQQALSSAAAAQKALSGVEWPDGLPWRVRMGIHTGEPMVVARNYLGLDVHRAARIMAAGHGGQVLVSQTTRDLVPPSGLRDLGVHRLKDLSKPERLYQLSDAEFPPLRSLNRTNLPIATGPLLGRRTELARIAELLAGGWRLVTMTGPGGSGKTRLALQAAAEFVDEFADGVFFVALAPLGHAASVPGAIAQSLGLRPDEDLHAYLATRRLLLVLDNAEHLGGVAQVVTDLLRGEIVVLVTSRSPLHLSAEVELAVEPLAAEAAAELFTLRAAAVGRSVAPDATVVELCRRLDNLPLAVELAAARSKLLGPRAILERLEQALPFLTGGPHDAPERQQTLLATIEWSHDLLSDAERVAVRRLAVFRGSFLLDAAEAVADADLDTVAALVDKSLLTTIGEARFLMLETLREFALEQLVEAGETEQTALRHARWYLQRLRDMAPERDGSRTEETLRWYDAEIANTWAALDALLVEDVQEAMSLVAELGPYWAVRGQIKAARDWMQAAFENVEPAKLLARDYQRLGMLTVRAADVVEARAAFERALDLATEAADELGASSALELLAVTAYLEGDHNRSVELGTRAVVAAERSGDPHQLARTRTVLALPLILVEQFDRARCLLEENVVFYEEMKDASYGAIVELNLAELELHEGNVTSAGKRALRALETFERLGADNLAAFVFEFLGAADLAGGRPEKAITKYGKALDLSAIAGDATNVLAAAVGLATAASGAEPGLAARTWAAAESKGIRASGIRREQSEGAMTAVRAALGEAEFEREAALGRALSLDETIELARELARLSEKR